MKYSEFIGKPKFETGVQGICYDFNDGVRIWLPKGDFHIKCTDLDTFTILCEKNLEALDDDGCVLYYGQSYYTHWLVEIQKDGMPLCSFQSDLKDRNVTINFWKSDGIALGEFVGALTVIEKFRCTHQCNIFVIINQKYLEISQRSYPDIIFIADEFDNLQKTYQQLPKDIYATYNINVAVGYTDATGNQHHFLPVDFRAEGCLRYFAGKLGLLDSTLGVPCHTFQPSSNSYRTIKEPYVCISGRGSKIKKEWNNSDGWVETVKYLKEMGYRVICIDGDGIEHNSPLEKALEVGLEDFTGYKPLQERVDLLYYADFFIGISSGLSWLAWGTGKPVILISGFSLPFTEFYTPYRIINYDVCHGCYNNFALWHFQKQGEYKGGLYESMSCKLTEHYLECSRKIDARVVCRNIDKLMEDYHLLPPKDRGINNS